MRLFDLTIERCLFAFYLPFSPLFFSPFFLVLRRQLNGLVWLVSPMAAVDGRHPPLAFLPTFVHKLYCFVFAQEYFYSPWISTAGKEQIIAYLPEPEPESGTHNETNKNLSLNLQKTRGVDCPEIDLVADTKSDFLSFFFFVGKRRKINSGLFVDLMTFETNLPFHAWG